MKKFIFLASMAGLSMSCFGQTEDESLSTASKDGDKVVLYNVISDDASDLTLLNISLPLWNMSFSKVNSSIYDLNATVVYSSSKLEGMLRYKNGLADRLANAGGPYGRSIFCVNEPQGAQEIGFTGSVFLKSSEKKVKETIRLRSSGKTTFVTDVDVSSLRSVGLTLGYSQGFQLYNFTGKTIQVLRDGESTPGEATGLDMSTMHNYKFLKVGVVFRKAIDFYGNFEGYGKRSSSRIVTTWVNVIGAVQNEFEDVFVPVSSGSDIVSEQNSIEYVARANMNDHNKKIPFGAEFGQRFTSKRGFISWEYGLKYLPGLSGTQNFMVDLGFNFTFNALRNK